MRENGNKLLRYLLYTLEIIVLFILQGTPGLFPEIFGARPILVATATAIIAMNESPNAAIGFGLLAGLLMDLGYDSTLGFYALILVIVCFFVSVISSSSLNVTFASAMVVALCVNAIIVVLGWVFQFLLMGYSHPAYALTNKYIPKYFYSMLLAPLTFVITRAIGNVMRPDPV